MVFLEVSKGDMGIPNLKDFETRFISEGSPLERQEYWGGEGPVLKTRGRDLVTLFSVTKRKESHYWDEILVPRTTPVIGYQKNKRRGPYFGGGILVRPHSLYSWVIRTRRYGPISKTGLSSTILHFSSGSGKSKGPGLILKTLCFNSFYS